MTRFLDLQDQDLLQRTKALVADERRSTVSVIQHLQEIERRKLYASLGYQSLFDYAVRELGYTESSAQRRISSMRLLKELPQVTSKLETGALSLSALSLARSFFRSEAQADHALSLEQKVSVLEQLEGKSTRECERALIALSSQPETFMGREQIRPVTKTHSEVRFFASEELLGMLEQIRGLLAHRHGHLSLADLMEEIAELALEKLGENHNRAASKPALEPELEGDVSPKALPAPEVISKQKPRRHIPAKLRRLVFRRDKGQCSYIDQTSGRRCGSRYALEVDHITPFGQGGETTPENLRLVCRNHNQWHAIQSYGVEKMERFLGVDSEPGRCHSTPI